MLVITRGYQLEILGELDSSCEANEIVQTSMSLDCQGKKGNVGFKVAPWDALQSLEKSGASRF